MFFLHKSHNLLFLKWASLKKYFVEVRHNKFLFTIEVMKRKLKWILHGWKVDADLFMWFTQTSPLYLSPLPVKLTHVVPPPLSDRHMVPLYSISNYYLILPWRILGIEGWLDYLKGYRQRQKRWYMKLCPQLVNKIVENYSSVPLERPLWMCSNNVGIYWLSREKKALIVV